MSRADSHNVGGEGRDAGRSDGEAGGGEGTSASHEKGGGELLVCLSFSVIVVVAEPLSKLGRMRHATGLC